jgi:hypothetical protein
MPELVMTLSALQSTRNRVRLHCSLLETELGTNVHGVLVLLEVGMRTMALSEVSTNCVVEVRVEIGLWYLVRGRTSHIDSSYTNFGQSTYT